MSERRHLIEARAPARVSIKSRNYACVFFSACLVTRRSITELSPRPRSKKTPPHYTTTIV